MTKPTKLLVQMERLFKALGDVTRLRILGLLLTGEVCVCHIHESLGIPQPKASRHLAYLRRSGLVRARKEGLWVHYRLAETGDAVLQAIQQAVTHALTQVDTIRKDAGRLRKKTGCCTAVEKARADDAAAILQLLERRRLPVPGLTEHLATTIVARENGSRVIGSAALEVYAGAALLRSVAVDEAHQGRGLGHDLVEGALRMARQLGVTTVYLLTTTAAKFFPRFGFVEITREEVPAAVKTSLEFTAACPSTATVMRKILDPDVYRETLLDHDDSHAVGTP
jgi:amino-acid N-acetyltransferase